MHPYAHYSDYFYDWLPDSPVEVDLCRPSLLVATPDDPRDNGLSLRVYGFDAEGKWIRDNDADGFLVPVQYGSNAANVTAPPTARIIRVQKAVSKGFVRLSTLEDGIPATRLGYYAPDQTEPAFRRIRINRRCAQIRIAYRKRERKISSLTDVIPLRNRDAIILALQARRLCLSDPVGGEALWATATQRLAEEQGRRNQGMPPRPIEVADDFGVHACGGFY